MGILDKAIAGLDELTDGDYYELAERGLENSAPIFWRDEVPMSGDDAPVEDVTEGTEVDHFHTVYHVSSPEMKKYYMLCRLLELRDSVDYTRNPYVCAADKHYSFILSGLYYGFWAGFDSEEYTTELLFEICPERCIEEVQLIWIVRDMLAYYSEHLGELEYDLRCGRYLMLAEHTEINYEN
jgi:hypothetical protein